MDEQRKPGWPFWCAVTLTLPLLYGASLGPACWLSSRFGGATVVTSVYRPVTWTAEFTESDFVMLGLQRYSCLGTSETNGYWGWTLDAEHPGNAQWVGLYLDMMPSELLTTPPASP